MLNYTTFGEICKGYKNVDGEEQMHIEFSDTEIHIGKFFGQKSIAAGEIESMRLESAVNHIRLKNGREIRLKLGRFMNCFLSDELSEFAAKHHISFRKEVNYSETELYFEDLADVMHRAEADQRALEAAVDPYVKEKLSDACSIQTEIICKSDDVCLVINIVKDGMKAFLMSEAAPDIYREKIGSRELYALDVLDEAMIVEYDAATDRSRWLTLDDVNNMIPSIRKTVDDMLTDGIVYAAEAAGQEM
jgi:hypothetical protein